MRYKNGKMTITNPNDTEDNRIREGGLLDNVDLVFDRVSPLNKKPKKSLNPLRRIKQKLATNIRPISYGAPILRIRKALGFAPEKDKFGGQALTNQQIRQKQKKAIQGGKDSSYPNNIVERQQLFNNVMGLPMDSYLGVDMGAKGLRNSYYKPTDAKDPDKNYFRSMVIEDEMKSRLSEINMLDRYIGSGKYYSATGGKITLNKGEDENGKYISYYDIWDLDPFGPSEEDKYGKSKVKIGPLNISRKTAHKLTDAAQNLLGVNTPEIYGRLYYDEGPNGEINYRSIEDEREAKHGKRLKKIMR